ncbi:TetR family transcriptional regulator [Rhodococcus wratislaviensis]|uniref:TetR family transcriptional regulator n=1 Tax=Rhodococcus wratislaviensis TaxID=44752 RepID=A0AB38FB18_RHOWR|nr:TetR/AcrR family transcriptional regulator [Rhodococcus wratislaviensis]REE76978.1 TetR family transcriptional regulator [Rhodococcus wratislaviensis]SPZ38780.1 putative TetR family transcriptional regulator [Rhodococcus wratislaviensis]
MSVPTKSPGDPGKTRRSHARANRARILDAAVTAFIADPDASMDDVARSAGVVRRTVYAHFPSREALVEGIADEASAALVAAMGDEAQQPERPDLAVAVMALRTWPIGDRFRMLLSFARRELGEQRIHDLLGVVRDRDVRVVDHGQRSGVFSSYLSPTVLVALAESMTMTLLDQANSGEVQDSGESFAVAYLAVLGLTPADGARVVDEARHWLREHPDVPKS